MLQATREAIVNFLGDRTDDEAIALLETVDNEGVDEENWKEKYEQNDKEWREKYTSRFKSSPAPVASTVAIEPSTPDPEERNESLNLNDLLFGKEG